MLAGSLVRTLAADFADRIQQPIPLLRIALVEPGYELIKKVRPILDFGRIFEGLPKALRHLLLYR